MLLTRDNSSDSLNIPLLSGPVLLGMLFSYGLFGVLCLQVFMYHIAFPQDSKFIKTFAYFTFTLEVVLTVSVTNTAWWCFADGFSDISHVLYFNVQSSMQPILTAIITSLYHFFYCWRIYRIARLTSISVLVAAASLTQLGMRIYIGVYFGKRQTSLLALEDSSPLVTASFVVTVVADAIITITLVSVLVTYRKQSTIKQTIGVLEKLIRFTVETGLVTTVVDVTGLTFYLASRNTTLYFTVFFAIAKIYSNTLMATLNSRMIIGSIIGSEVSSNITHAESQMTDALWNDQRGRGTHTVVSGIHFAGAIVGTVTDRSFWLDSNHSTNKSRA